MAKLRARYVRDYFWQTRVRKILGWVLQIAAVIILSFICAYLFGQRVVITEGSMEPTLMAGDRVLMNTAAYKLSAPERGDLIVFRNSTDKNSGLQVKRVIGLPGETVQIRDGQILINQETYIEDKDFALITNPGIAEEPVLLGSDEYFVLGDNRNSSEDSRHLDVGMIQADKIVGKLWLRYSPFERFGFME